MEDHSQLISLDDGYKELFLEKEIKEVEIIYQDKKIDIMKIMKKNSCAYEIR